MGRYVARKVGGNGPVRSLWDYGAPLVPDLRVDAAEPVCTGLIGVQGNELWRLNNPIGFG